MLPVVINYGKSFFVSNVVMARPREKANIAISRASAFQEKCAKEASKMKVKVAKQLKEDISKYAGL